MEKKKLTELRKTYPDFYYDSYHYTVKTDELLVSFCFIAGDIEFKPSVSIKFNSEIKVAKKNIEAMEKLIFHLGMIEMFSYWKAFCSKKIIVKAGYLDKNQLDWWKDLLINGMGQYFFENKIDFTKDSFLEIYCDAEYKANDVFSNPNASGVLLPIGGGKDSATSIELLKKVDCKITPFVLNNNRNTKKMIEVAKLSEAIVATREIEKGLLKLNQEGCLNGHTPFVAYLSFLGLLVCMVEKKKYLVLSNERSSNEGNTFFKGKEINHQYSKTVDFEKKFRNYVKKYLINDLEYFSLLRPLYELQIARIFSKNSHYFDVFLSCNEAQKTYSGTKKKTGKWCGSCSKCLFVYIILSPFLNKLEMNSIFKKDLFEDKDLIPIMLELVDEKKVKPLECVGTKKECLVGLYLNWKNNDLLGLKQPILLDYFGKKVMINHNNLEKEADKMLNNWDKKNFVPVDWANEIYKYE